MAKIPEITSKWTDNNGTPLPFAKLYSYAAGSSVPKALYSDYNCTIPLSNPLIADGSGKFREFFLTTGRYRFGLHDQLDALIDIRDDVDASGGTGGTHGTVTSVQLVLGESLDVAAQVTSLPVTDAGNIDLEWRNQPARKALMSPTGGSGKPVFRDIVWADVIGTSPYLPLAGGTMANDAIVFFPSSGSESLTLNKTIANFQNGDNNGHYSNAEAWVEDSYVTAYMQPGKLCALAGYWFAATRSITADVTTGARFDINGGTDTASIKVVSSTSPYIGVYTNLANTNSGASVLQPDLFSMAGSNSVATGTYSSLTANVVYADAPYFEINGRSTNDYVRIDKNSVFSALNRLTAPAANFSISSTTTCFVGQDFDIRNGKALQLAGVTRISTGGAGTFTGLTSSGGSTITGDIIVQKTASGETSVLIAALTSNYATVRFTTSGSDRWLARKTSTLESGANAGSDFEIVSMTDSGVVIDRPIQIARVAGGAITLSRKLALAPAAAGYASLNIPTRSAATTSPVAGDLENDGSHIVLYDRFYTSRGRGFGIFTLAGLPRWLAGLSGTESGSNSGSNYALTAYDDAGVSLGNIIVFPRAASGAVTISRQINASSGVGFYGVAAPASRPAVTGSRGGNAALASLLTTLAACGIITDSTTV